MPALPARAVHEPAPVLARQPPGEQRRQRAGAEAQDGLDPAPVRQLGGEAGRARRQLPAERVHEQHGQAPSHADSAVRWPSSTQRSHAPTTARAAAAQSARAAAGATPSAASERFARAGSGGLRPAPALPRRGQEQDRGRGVHPVLRACRAARGATARRAAGRGRCAWARRVRGAAGAAGGRAARRGRRRRTRAPPAPARSRPRPPTAVRHSSRAPAASSSPTCPARQADRRLEQREERGPPGPTRSGAP